MERSRVKRYKDYRKDLNRDDDVLLVNNSSNLGNKTNKNTSRTTLSTLSVSYDDIMSAANKVEQDKKQDKIIVSKIKLFKIIKIASVVLLCILLIVAIIVAGVFIFR